MTSQNWQDRLVSLDDLQREADNLEPWDYGIFTFLKNVGSVPFDVMSVAASQVRLTIDRTAIPAGYLASAAYEWDSWGPSQPSDFINAIEAELDPTRRDIVAQVLTSLGRSTESE